MLYHLFQYLSAHFDFPGESLFRFITFRSAMAFITAFLLGILYGKRIIGWLRRRQLGETVRDLGLEGQKSKEGTPTMGGIIIIGATLISILLYNDLTNIYIQILILSLIWMGLIGFIDDYIKTIKKDKTGLRGKFKVMGQVGLGLIIATLIFFHPDITIRTKKHGVKVQSTEFREAFNPPRKSLQTTLPFFKNNEFNYKWLLPASLRDNQWAQWLLFTVVVIFIITAVSNGTNLADGIDGLAAGTSAISIGALAVLAWLSGNMFFANYLNIMYIPHVGEISVFLSAFLGAILAFLWFNAYPASVFMGDTGSLTIGAIIAVISFFIRKELLLPVLGGIFLIEAASVIIQTRYFKYTKKKYGEGRRVFLMAPIHHHFQKLGLHENKIVIRFWIVAMLLAVTSIALLKIK
ncbi:MAG: phospho-N-acetylmuramoyl-pentapeptide-transferase [Chlorobi bacterium]|nr:phospho-N-acetylmuramoyl-pentapeptide-transferase [Chlorobiota bacterium]